MPWVSLTVTAVALALALALAAARLPLVDSDQATEWALEWKSVPAQVAATSESFRRPARTIIEVAYTASVRSPFDSKDKLEVGRY